MRIKQHLWKLAREIGARPAGSESSNRAIDYATEVLRGAGFAVEQQPFDCMLWQPGDASLTANGKPVPAQPASYALGCDVQGEIARVDTVEALRKADLRGKVAVIHGALGSEALMPKGFPFWNPDEHKEIIALLENGCPAAVVTVNENFAPIIEDGDFEIPCAVAPTSALDALAEGAAASLRMDCARNPSHSRTIIATRGEYAKRVCLCAHLDSKYTTPGAIDDAGGVATLLALAQRLKGRELPFTLEITLFASEESYKNEGEQEYIRAYLQDPSRYLWVAYADGAGMQNGRTAYSLYECPEPLATTAAALGRECGLTEMEPWPMGDHTIYVMQGIPAISLTSEHIFEAAQHDAGDTAEKVDIARLEESALFLEKLLLSQK